MNKIWKYPVSFGGSFNLTMPVGARILKLDIQFNDPQIWAIVDPDKEIEVREFISIGTGQAFPKSDRLEYIDSYQVNGGQYVWHVFEHKEEN